MNGEHDKFERQITNLTDALVNDILAASDEKILEEGLLPHTDIQAVQDRVDQLIESSRIKAGKIRMAQARQAIESQERPGLRIFALSLEEKSRVLQQLPSADEHLRSTLAARKGQDFSETDLDAALHALYELGFIDENGQVR